MKSFLGVLAVLVLVAGGVYGIQSVNAGDKCCAASASKASADKGEAKVEATNATAATATTTTAGVCDSKTTAVNTAVNAEHAGAQCTYNAKTASAQCTPSAKTAEGVMTAEATMAKLAHCGIDCRTADASVLSAKLANSQCGSYTQEQWTAMIKSAQALDAKQADAIFASATSEKPCVGDACPMKKVAMEMSATQNEEKKESTN